MPAPARGAACPRSAGSRPVPRASAPFPGGARGVGGGRKGGLSVCGIAGFQGGYSAGLLERMTAAVAHRGPDGCGTLLL